VMTGGGEHVLSVAVDVLPQSDTAAGRLV